MLFVIDEFGQSSFHFIELLIEILIVGFNLLDIGLVGLNDSGYDSGHKFDYGLEFDRCIFVFG